MNVGVGVYCLRVCADGNCVRELPSGHFHAFVPLMLIIYIHSALSKIVFVVTHSGHCIQC